MARRRRRSNGLPLLSFGPPLLAIAAWDKMHEPFRGQGLIVLLAIGCVCGLVVPALLVSLDKVPMLLIPPKTIARHRTKQINGTRWHDPKLREELASSKIPSYLHRAVLRADRHTCVWCGYVGGQAPRDLHVDHIRPFRGGGLTAIWNLMTLCSKCNIIKSNYWRDRDGYIHYQPGLRSPNLQEAADILRYEKWHRLSPARWVRAGWDLAA